MSNIRILIVEDDQAMAKLMENYIEDIGMESIGTVASGKLAITKAKDENPDIILMDIAIEGDMDGIEVATNIASETKIPIIFTSATSEDDIVEKLQNNKYPYQYACMSKPILKPILKMKIDMALKVKKMMD